MKRVVFRDLPLRTNRFDALPKIVHVACAILFAGACVLDSIRWWLPPKHFGEHHWPEGLLLILATASTIASLTLRLPGQNVMLASVVIALFGAGAVCLGATTAIPFGPITFTPNVGQMLFYPLPWSMPMLWVLAMLNARGVARLIMRPWRQNKNYGFWVIGIAAVLIVMFDLALEPFAVSIMNFWVWSATKLRIAWYTAPVVNFIGWALVALLILVFTTPALINKKPGKQPADYYPLAVWLGIHAVFLTAAVVHALWPAAIVTGISSIIVAIAALLGTRKGSR